MSRTTTSLVAALAAGALLGLAGTATATPDLASPVSGDDRATAHEGNAVERDCAELFPGSAPVAVGDLTVEVDGSNTNLDITAADGVEVVGVVVKGGPAYNVYAPGDLGELPWLDLHSPLVPSGKPAQISHWFACGVEGAPTTNPTSSAGETPTSSSRADEPGAEPGAGPETSATEDVEPVAEEDELAATGFDGGTLVALGAALLLGGGALLVVMRTRGARR
jgi:hypothetical protein